MYGLIYIMAIPIKSEVFTRPDDEEKTFMNIKSGKISDSILSDNIPTSEILVIRENSEISKIYKNSFNTQFHNLNEIVIWNYNEDIIQAYIRLLQDISRIILIVDITHYQQIYNCLNNKDIDYEVKKLDDDKVKILSIQDFKTIDKGVI